MHRIDGFFLPMRQGNRFCLLLRPAASAAARGAVLFVHPFAEEMNNARRMAALQARAFADAGWTVLQVDLLGCGDSSGDFADADWHGWVDDIVNAAAWLHAEAGHRPMLWGLRAGCLLASQAARTMQPTPDLVAWQPVTSGKQFLQQFLRLKVARQIVMQTGDQWTGTKELRDNLARGEVIEIAGYPLSPALALGMENAELELPGLDARTAWFEVSRGVELSPASRTLVQRWHDAGHRIETHVVQGSPFWQIPGVGDCPALIESTLGAVEAWRA